MPALRRPIDHRRRALEAPRLPRRLATSRILPELFMRALTKKLTGRFSLAS